MIINEYSIHDKINMKTLKGKCFIWANTPRELTQWNSYGVPNSDFKEPVIFGFFRDISNDELEIIQRFSNIPFIRDGGQIYPALGYYCTGKEWIPIEGYREPNFAPGFSWRNEFIPSKQLRELNIKVERIH